MTYPATISDLRQQPAFFDAVADRIWRAGEGRRALRPSTDHRNQPRRIRTGLFLWAIVRPAKRRRDHARTPARYPDPRPGARRPAGPDRGLEPAERLRRNAAIALHLGGRPPEAQRQRTRDPDPPGGGDRGESHRLHRPGALREPAQPRRWRFLASQCKFKAISYRISSYTPRSRRSRSPMSMP